MNIHEDDVLYIRNLDVLSTLIVAAQLKHKGLHMMAQFSLWHMAHDLRHPEIKEQET